MATLMDYVALAARVYRDVRGEDNINSLPGEWNEIAYQSGQGFNGLTIGAYKNGDEIIIAIKGTDLSSSRLVH